MINAPASSVLPCERCEAPHSSPARLSTDTWAWLEPPPEPTLRRFLVLCVIQVNASTVHTWDIPLLPHFPSEYQSGAGQPALSHRNAFETLSLGGRPWAREWERTLHTALPEVPEKGINAVKQCLP
ncbi:hypothetical protein LX36DRAFT_655465 [Colletotrichum falcatum]|nr:hypothetical protein LX36DRAFT_655465 [Colletotrichum falcatum]